MSEGICERSDIALLELTKRKASHDRGGADFLSFTSHTACLDDEHADAMCKAWNRVQQRRSVRPRRLTGRAKNRDDEVDGPDDMEFGRPCRKCCINDSCGRCRDVLVPEIDASTCPRLLSFVAICASKALWHVRLVGDRMQRTTSFQKAEARRRRRSLQTVRIAHSAVDGLGELQSTRASLSPQSGGDSISGQVISVINNFSA